jgi:putative ABC transport system ATP-binding protein
LAAPDLELQRDEHCVLLGPSGSGKTTLLHILAGILRPSEGRVFLDGEDLFAPACGDPARAARIGVVPQKLHLLASLTALDNVRLAQQLIGRRDDAAALTLLRQLGLETCRHALPARLSAGEQQRVAIARAVINTPRLVLADEPTSSLDDAAAAAATGLLLDAARSHRALLVVATHDSRIRHHFARVVELRAPAR